MTSFLDMNQSPAEQCYQHIRKVIDKDIIILFDSIEKFIFQNVDHGLILSLIPQWVVDYGISPELNSNKDLYEKLRCRATHPIFGRCIYFYDLLGKVSALQDRLSAVILFMRHFYSEVPCKAHYEESQYTSGVKCNGERETDAHMFLNSIFVAYASAFDLISKIAVEQFEFDNYDFGKYKKMKSVHTLYKKSLNKIDSSLKAENMLFFEPPIIRKIISFRDEFVHNGPWDFRCSVYCTAVDGKPADEIIYSPDMDELGNFMASGSRNKFYSQANRINIQLPDLINEATIVLKNTINQISELYKQKTNLCIDKQFTKECLDAIGEYFENQVRLQTMQPHS